MFLRELNLGFCANSAVDRELKTDNFNVLTDVRRFNGQFCSARCHRDTDGRATVT